MLHYHQSTVYMRYPGINMMSGKTHTSRLTYIFVLDIAFWQILTLIRSWPQFLGWFSPLWKMNALKFKNNLPQRKMFITGIFYLNGLHILLVCKFWGWQISRQKNIEKLFLQKFWLLVSIIFKIKRFSLGSNKTGTLSEEYIYRHYIDITLINARACGTRNTEFR